MPNQRLTLSGFFFLVYRAIAVRLFPFDVANLGHKVSDQPGGDILKEHGIEPVPKRCRRTTWKTFFKAHWDVLAAVDFTTIEVWTMGGLVTFYLPLDFRVDVFCIWGDDRAHHQRSTCFQAELGQTLV